MVSKRRSSIPPPPPADASDEAKAAYYEKYDPLDILDAGYLEEEGIFRGRSLIVDLRPERGLIRIPVQAKVARRLHRVARRAGCTPSELASRLLERDLPSSKE